MSRISTYPSRPPSRPPSEQLCDLHVYKVPLELWRLPLNNILNQSVTDTISIGIIRVNPEIALVDIRAEIQRQLEELAPKDYVFLRSVGRSITRLKTKQEYQLKAKHFLPPVHYAPELFLLEATPELREALAVSDSSSQHSPTSINRGSPAGRSYRDGYRSYRDRNGYPGEHIARQRALDRASPTRHYSPLPRINPSSLSQSREGSPASLIADPFPEDSHPSSDSHRPQPYSVSKHSPEPDHNAQPSRSKVNNIKKKGGREEDHPPQTHRNFKAAPKTFSRKEVTEKGKGRQSNHSPTKTYHGPGSKAEITDRVPPPINPGSPEHSPVRKEAADRVYRGANGFERDGTYNNHTNEDSGVAGFSPEDPYKLRDKENFYNSLNSKTRDMQNRLQRDQFNVDDDYDERHRLQDLEEGADLDRDRWARDQDERRRKGEQDRRRTEEERKKEEARRKAEEKVERQRREEEEERQREEEEERQREAEEARLRGGSDEELNRFPSPPPLRMSPTELPSKKDTESARQRRKEEKKKLLSELDQARDMRHNTEKEREELVKKAKTLQNKTQNRRNHARDLWKKRYFEEKKKTPPLEEQTNRLQEELEALHRKMMAVLEGPREKNFKLGDNKPSQKNNYVIQCAKLQYDIDELKRRIEKVKMNLTAEMKLRNQAEVELRALRAELVQKKINLSLSRSQHFAALSPGMKDWAPVPAIPVGKGNAESVEV